MVFPEVVESVSHSPVISPNFPLPLTSQDLLNILGRCDCSESLTLKLSLMAVGINTFGLEV